MRADRLLSILLLLQVGKRLTARELARRLEVSERTILRDMSALGAAGVPLTAERGAGGGWALVQEYRSDLTGLNTAELQALFLARSSRLLADLGLSRASDTALIKLRASLPAVSRRSIEHTRERLHIDGAGWYQSIETFPFLAALQEAVWQDLQVQMTYQRADGTTTERLVSPLGLVAKGNVWYMAAAADGELRSYRVSRVQTAEIIDEPCTRPEGFDLASFWKQSVADLKLSLPRYSAVVRVVPELLAQIRRRKTPNIEQEGPQESDGWIKLWVMFEVESEAHDFVISHAPYVEVVEPIALRNCVRKTALSIAAIHHSHGEAESQNS